MNEITLNIRSNIFQLMEEFKYFQFIKKREKKKEKFIALTNETFSVNTKTSIASKNIKRKTMKTEREYKHLKCWHE